MPNVGRVAERVLCYAWRQRPPSPRILDNQRVVLHMRTIHREVHETYGSPWMHAELQTRGLSCNVKRVARLMWLHHLGARHKAGSRVPGHRFVH